jgi:hypothetical protein
VPQVMLVDVESGIIGIEWIDGESVRSVLGADEEMVDNSYAGGGDMEDTSGQKAKAGGGGGGGGESKSGGTAEYGIYGISPGGFIFVLLRPSFILHPSSILQAFNPSTLLLICHFISFHIICVIVIAIT